MNKFIEFEQVGNSLIINTDMICYIENNSVHLLNDTVKYLDEEYIEILKKQLVGKKLLNETI